MSMNYVIDNGDKKSRLILEVNPKKIPVKLIDLGYCIILCVGPWHVFELDDDGTGILCRCINKSNCAGLQLDAGRIKLRDGKYVPEHPG